MENGVNPNVWKKAKRSVLQEEGSIKNKKSKERNEKGAEPRRELDEETKSWTLVQAEKVREEEKEGDGVKNAVRGKDKAEQAEP
ncbi:hypothetical protein KM043_012985 [Ampulex compressa]|nr:hypothetical protein KM043_012985 [Ampulex compressa]